MSLFFVCMFYVTMCDNRFLCVFLTGCFVFSVLLLLLSVMCSYFYMAMYDFVSFDSIPDVNSCVFGCVLVGYVCMCKWVYIVLCRPPYQLCDLYFLFF